MLAMIAGMLVLTRTVDLHWHTHLADATRSEHQPPLTYLAHAAVPHLAFDQDVDTAVAGDDAGKSGHRLGVDTPREPVAFLTATQRDTKPRHTVYLTSLCPPQILARLRHRSVIRPPLRAPPV